MTCRGFKAGGRGSCRAGTHDARAPVIQFYMNLDLPDRSCNCLMELTRDAALARKADPLCILLGQVLHRDVNESVSSGYSQRAVIPPAAYGDEPRTSQTRRRDVRGVGSTE